MHLAFVGTNGQAGGGRDGTEALYLQQGFGLDDLDQLGDLRVVAGQLLVELVDLCGQSNRLGTGDRGRQLLVAGTPAGHLGNLHNIQGLPGVQAKLVDADQGGQRMTRTLKAARTPSSCRRRRNCLISSGSAP